MFGVPPQAQQYVRQRLPSGVAAPVLKPGEGRGGDHAEEVLRPQRRRGGGRPFARPRTPPQVGVVERTEFRRQPPEALEGRRRDRWRRGRRLDARPEPAGRRRHGVDHFVAVRSAGLVLGSPRGDRQVQHRFVVLVLAHRRARRPDAVHLERQQPGAGRPGEPDGRFRPVGRLQGVVVFQPAVGADVGREGGAVDGAFRAAGALQAAAECQADRLARVTEGPPGSRPARARRRRRRFAQARRFDSQGAWAGQVQRHLALRAAGAEDGRQRYLQRVVVRLRGQPGAQVDRLMHAQRADERQPPDLAGRPGGQQGRGAEHVARAQPPERGRRLRAVQPSNRSHRDASLPAPRVAGRRRQAGGRQVQVHRFGAALLRLQQQAGVHGRPAGRKHHLAGTQGAELRRPGSQRQHAAGGGTAVRGLFSIGVVIVGYFLPPGAVVRRRRPRGRRLDFEPVRLLVEADGQRPFAEAGPQRREVRKRHFLSEDVAGVGRLQADGQRRAARRGRFRRRQRLLQVHGQDRRAVDPADAPVAQQARRVEGHAADLPVGRKAHRHLEQPAVANVIGDL